MERREGMSTSLNLCIMLENSDPHEISGLLDLLRECSGGSAAKGNDPR